MKEALTKYDKYLRFKSLLNGAKSVYRKSPFSSSVEFSVLSIENQFVGSGLWIMQKISLMDNQRFDIVGGAFDKNLKVKRKRVDNRMSSEVANFMLHDNILI